MPREIINHQRFKDRFVKWLRVGATVGHAAHAVGISRSQAYAWRDEDQVFSKSWAEAAAAGNARLEDEAFRRARRLFPIRARSR